MKPPLQYIFNIFKRVQKLSPIVFTGAQRRWLHIILSGGAIVQRRVAGALADVQGRQGAAAALVPCLGQGWGEPGPAAQLLTAVLPVTPQKVSMALNCRCRKGNVQKSREQTFLAADILPCHFPQAELWPGLCPGWMHHQHTRWPESDSHKLSLELILLRPYLKDYYCYQGSWRKATITQINFFLWDSNHKKKKK